MQKKLIENQKKQMTNSYFLDQMEKIEENNKILNKNIDTEQILNK